ncbi:methionine synthase [Rarobacter faecitabidus]|uniref:Cobalamin-independent methionine synthase catalytic subunit n=1 Tax=Rarobacter faecitabidus TaxID=13243 RepID=A0A542ZXA6_RARFA|nr:hypothetical protein [Rarobacter faecitabidus]TQL64866.1 hypothetical protein FB461_1392 [Rarobacter faecitabidus]
MIRVTGLGLVPGADPLEAQLAVLDELTHAAAGQGIGLPFEVQLARSADDSVAAVARACAMLDQVFAERGPHGWKLADRPGLDLMSERRWLDSQDEAVQIALSGYDGGLSVSGLGPITLAARVYLARGDLAVSDPGAIKEIAHAYAEGLATHVARLREHVPGAGPIEVQLDEPLLGAAMAGVLPNFSGMARIRRLSRDVTDQILHIVTDRLSEPVTVHLGESMVGLDAVRTAGVAGVGLNVGQWDPARWAAIAECIEAGTPVSWGMPAPRFSQCSGPQIVELADKLWQPWRRIGLAVSGLSACSMVDQARSRPHTLGQVRDRLASLVKVAEILTERLD